MLHKDLWKYASKEHCQDLLLSFQLLDEVNWSKKKQIACLYTLSNNIDAHYKPATIPKRDNTLRHLFVPEPLLKKVQQNILKNILNSFPVSQYATAYKKGGGVVTNAEPHIGQKQLLKLDIENFFGSISFPMVYKSAFPHIYFPPSIRTLLTELCCYKDCLPQGAPTSAAISNLVMKPFDEYIGRWCSQQQITYTRYCDDMTFSGQFDVRKVKNKVRCFLQTMGFTLNTKKTKLLTQHERQTVTGIVVNSKIQTSALYRKSVRQELYYCQKFGVIEHLTAASDKRYFPLDKANIMKYLSTLSGKINYILQVNPEDNQFREARLVVSELIKKHR